MLDVYKSFYKFKEQPFRLSPDYRFCFSHPSYANAKSYLKYAVVEGEGLVVITGEAGTGKTTLIDDLLAEIDSSRVRVATLANVQVDSANLLNMVLEEFELSVDSQGQTSPLLALKQFLTQQNKNGHRCILIVDEAQGLSISSLEVLRLISNLQYNNNLLLQVFLVGQGPLMDIIRGPGLEQLHQRFIAAAHLESLSQTETEDYIKYRLRKAGWDNDPVLNEDLMRLVYIFSDGIPRRINLICHRLFLYGGLKQKHELVGADALHVIVELHREGLLAQGASKEFDNASGNVKLFPVKKDNV